MSSLLDLPDEAIFNIGTYLEHNIHSLGLFLLIHPRINLLCYPLRHRSRIVCLNDQSPLSEYLRHPLWLKHVHAISVTVNITTPLHTHTLKELVKAEERYDEQLALAIGSLTSVRKVVLDSSRTSQQTLFYVVSLPRTFTAIAKHHDIQDVQLSNLNPPTHIQLGLKLAQSLPACSTLKIVVPRTRGIPLDASLPEYLATSSARKTLRSLSFSGFRLSMQEDMPNLTHIPELPALRHLSNYDGHVWSHDQRQLEVDFLAAVLKKASFVETLEIAKPAMLGLSRRDITPKPSVLHLHCSRTSGPPTTGWGARYHSVGSLVLSGPGAPGAAESILDDDMRAVSYPFPHLQYLTLIDVNGWVSRPEYDSMAAEQGISLQVLEQCPDLSAASAFPDAGK